MTSPELTSFIQQQKELGVPEANYRSTLLIQGWNKQDIDEALSAISSHNQPNNLVPLNRTPKRLSLLIGTQIIFIVLLVVGFVIGNMSGHVSSLNDLISFVGVILIIPGFILAVIGIKDAIVCFKNKTDKGATVLILSLVLLVLSVIFGAHLYKIFRFLV